MKYFSPLLTSLLIGLAPFLASADDTLPERIDMAVEVLQKVDLSDSPIPQSVLEQATGVAIVKVFRGGLIIGGSHGNGVVLKQLKKNKWTAPLAFDMGGGSFGAQIGGDVIGYVFVLNNEAALGMFTSENEVKFDAGASATAGPNNASASKQALPGESIYVYSTTDGAFAGATIGGSYIQVQPKVNQATYGIDVSTDQILSGQVEARPPADKLTNHLNGKN